VVVVVVVVVIEVVIEVGAVSARYGLVMFVGWCKGWVMGNSPPLPRE